MNRPRSPFPARFSLAAIAVAIAFACIDRAATIAQGHEPNPPPVHAETRAQREARMAWWREARFGMFIHWGLYSIPAGEWKGKTYGGASEWLMHTAKIPASEYHPLHERFNPVRFNADEWVRIARLAGMKYIVITSKHHDGFALFDSAHSDYDIMATPFKRDIMKELADASAKQGIRMCWYHSILDWHHPDYLPRRAWDRRENEPPANFDRFNTYVRNQVTELLTKYGPIGVMWFDGEWEETWTNSRGIDLYNLCRTLQPNTIINNRVGKGRDGMAGMTRGEAPGDFGTPEQEIPATGIPGVDWESCMTMNDSWGFKRSDANWKSSKTLIRNLIDCASKGGNYLLNVGPTEEGLIPQESIHRLTEVGDWMEHNGESIYGTGAGPFRKLKWGRCTTKGGGTPGDTTDGGSTTLYLHVFDWPMNGALIVPGLKNEVTSAAFLGITGSSLPFERTEDGWRIGLPPEGFHPAATVITLTIKGEPNVAITHLRPDSRGVFDLLAEDADLKGGVRLEHRWEIPNLGYWTDARAEASWTIDVPRKARYNVEVEAACHRDEGGGAFEIEVAGKMMTPAVLKQELLPTRDWGAFIIFQPGQVEIDQPGTITIKVRSAGPLPKSALMNLRRVLLIPAKE